jgi:hypothetical protein
MHYLKLTNLDNEYHLDLRYRQLSSGENGGIPATLLFISGPGFTGFSCEINKIRIIW